MDISRINAQQATDLIAQKQAKVVDIREQSVFQQSHIKDAFHLTNANINDFFKQVDTDTPVIVCCYHGVSSINAAMYLANQGYQEVYSLDGGFEMWRLNHPVVSQ